MKKYSIFLNGELIKTDTEEEIEASLREDWKKIVLELSVGEIEFFQSDFGSEWEIERVL